MGHQETPTLLVSTSGRGFIQDGPDQVSIRQPILNGRIARWTLMLSEFDLKYTPLKAIKGRAISDFLADNATPDSSNTDTLDFPDEDIFHAELDVWNLYFDGASNYRGCGVGILIISPQGDHTPLSIKLDFDVTNNGAEYEACLHGLQAAIGLKIKKLKVHGDSSLIINQVSGNWKIKSESLAPYQSKIDQLIPYFDYINFTHLPREENQFADALSKLASLVNIQDNMAILPILVERRCVPAYINNIEIGDGQPQPEPWYQEIVNLIAHQEYPLNIK